MSRVFQKTSVLFWIFLPACCLLSACAYSGLIASSECRVLSESLAGQYEGECRRGLAHGQGIAQGVDRYEGSFRRGLPHGLGEYHFAGGDIYNGYWKRGLKHGIGTFYDAQLDSLYHGQWEQGEMISAAQQGEGPAYVVRYRRNITRQRFQRIGDGNRVFFRLAEEPGPGRITQLSVFGSSGFYMEYGHTAGHEEVEFPFTGKIVFLGPSRIGHTMLQVELLYEINQPGNWEIIIHF